MRNLVAKMSPDGDSDVLTHGASELQPAGLGVQAKDQSGKSIGAKALCVSAEPDGAVLGGSQSAPDNQ